MTFGYNANAAFGNTTADIVDYAKGLLSSLIDEREEDDVICSDHYIVKNRAEIFPRSCRDLSYL